MAAVSTIKVNGRTVRTPGAYSSVDTTAAVSPSIVSGGIVALVGQAANGQPNTVLSFDNLDGLRNYFSVADAAGSVGMRLAGTLLYTGANDDLVAGTPTKVICVKCNPDTQSTGKLTNASGDVVDLTSADYGAQTNQINITVAAGSAGGIALTIKQGTTIESGDNIGADTAMSLLYTGGFADTATATTGASGLTIAYTKAGLTGELGIGQILTATPSNSVLSISSTSALDSYQKASIYGVDAVNAPIFETLSLNGTGTVTGSKVFKIVTAVKLDGVMVGDITVVDGGSTTLVTLDGATSTITAPAAGIWTIQGGNAAETAQVLISGYSAAGDPISETVTLSGVSVISTTKSYTSLLYAKALSTLLGTATIKDSAAGTFGAAITIGAGQIGQSNEKGMIQVSGLPVSGAITVTGVGATQAQTVLRGIDATGNAVAEAMGSLGIGASATSTTSFQRLDQIEVGQSVLAGSVTITGNMRVIASGNLETAESTLNDTGAFTAVSYKDTRLIADLDVVTGSSIAAALNLTSGAADVVDFINESSSLVNATKSTGATGTPDPGGALFLAGGTTVAATAGNFQSAIDLLNGEDVNIVVALSDDASVSAYVKSHCALASSTLRSERNAYAPMSTALSKSALQAATTSINSQWVSCVAQNVDLFDEEGVRRTYGSVAMACIAAGMQASSDIGTPLTYKYLNALSISQSAFDPTNDGETMLGSGLMFAREYVGLGIRWVRSITSYQKKANRIYTEMSANESLSACVRDLRGYLEPIVIGQPTSTVSSEVVRGLAVGRLEAQAVSGIIASFQNVTVSQSGDLVTVSFEVAPSEPTNFVLLTAHVITFATAS